jgi:hypothetical protein
VIDGRVTTYRGQLERHPNGDWSKEGVNETTLNGMVVEKTMWKESFRRDVDYWEKSAFIKRSEDEEETFENNKGYKKNKTRHFKDVFGMRIPTHEVL